MNEPTAPDNDADWPEERRQWTRVTTGLDVRVEAAGLTVRGRVRDLSLAGVYLFCDPPFPKGTACSVTLVLVGADPPLTIELNGHVVHAETEGMGIEFTEMPVDSLGHVRNLVRYNTEDSDFVEDELQRPPFPKSRRPTQD
ncbi:MAG: PilZ domain-containing protein [Nitrospirota bacterium]